MKQLVLVVSCLCFGVVFSYGQTYRIGGINNRTTAIFVNSVFVGSFDGFRVDYSNDVDSVISVNEPVEINGKLFKDQYHYFCSKSFKFVSLQELPEKYRDENKPLYPPVFMINEKILTRDNTLSFKIDENYIQKVICINSDELGYREGKEPFTIVSILTKTPENMRRYPPPSNIFNRDSEEWKERNRGLVEIMSKRYEENIKNKVEQEE